MRGLRTWVGCMVSVLAVSADVKAQAIVVPAKVRDWTGNAQTTTTRSENTTTYVLISGTANGQPFDMRCEANAGCRLPAGATEVFSNLIYDNTREKLVKCNNTPVTVDGASCQSAGVISAELTVRLGELKLIPAKAAGYSALTLSTSSRGVTLEFAESSEDHWRAGYRTSGVNFKPDFAVVPAGSYRVYADDLIEHCKPTQTNDGVEVTVPEGGQAEVTVLFAGTDCTVTVKRADNDDSGAHGTVSSTPAGMSCDADVTKPCVGTFAYGTSLSLTPVPATGYKASWVFAECSVSSGVCTQTITSNRTFNLYFRASDPADPEPDAGSGAEDAGSGDAQDAGGTQDAGPSEGDDDGGLVATDSGAGSMVDAGTFSPSGGDGAADSGIDGPSGPESEGGSDDSCSAGGKPSGTWLPLLLAALWMARRRKRT